MREVTLYPNSVLHCGHEPVQYVPYSLDSGLRSRSHLYWVASFTGLIYRANGSNAKPMAPTCAESSHLPHAVLYRGHEPVQDRGPTGVPRS
jgi:hypothetical protein